VTEREGFIGLRLRDRYRVEQPLAQGARCTVYQGIDETLNRRIALKAVPPADAATYRAAIQATAVLSHPAIVVVWDVLAHEDWLFVVQEYIDGEPLAAKIAVGLSSALAVNMALQLARVLAYAHHHQVAHGDLTPAAVLMERDGTLRLNNFALPLDPAYFAAAAEMEVMLARALNVSRDALPATAPDDTPLAADIRALGLLLWQTLTTAGPTGERHDFRADVPADLRQVVARAVVRSHPERLITAEETIAALEPLARDASARAAEEEQPTPSPIQSARAARADAPLWSTEDTQVNAQPWGAGFPGAPGPISSPRKTRVLRDPGEMPPVRPGVPSGPLRPAAPSGPLRAPVPSGPLRAPVPSGPLGTTVPNSQPRNFTAPPYRTTSQPQYAGPLGRPSGAPPPIPWRDDPAVARYSAPPERFAGARGAATSKLGPARQRQGFGVLPVVALGIVLFIACFVIGYLMPLIFPFH
jgi:hypothetical protein